MANTYEYQAQRIEQALTAHRVPARVWQATVTPRFVRFDVTTGIGVPVGRVTKLDAEVAMALGVASVRIWRDGGAIHVEVPRPGQDTRTVEVREILRRLSSPIPPYTGLLGVEADGAPLMLRIDSPDVAHVLIAGTTGSGKTALLRSLLVSLALLNHPGNLRMILLDPKERGLGALAGLRHAGQVISEPGAIGQTLAGLVAEMERRRQAEPHLIVAVDELADLILGGEPGMIESLTRLTQRGREVGIHVIAATQRPATALVGGLMKANFPVRLVGAVASADDARVATGRAGSGAERLTGRGDFLLICRGQPLRFQAAYANDAELMALIALAGAERKRRSLADLMSAAPASAPLQLTGAPVHHLPTPILPPVASGAPVHHLENEDDVAPDGQRGVLPRRFGGPSAEEIARLRERYAQSNSLNEVVRWGYGSKSPLTFQWVKQAVLGQVMEDSNA